LIAALIQSYFVRSQNMNTLMFPFFAQPLFTVAIYYGLWVKERVELNNV